MVLVATAKKSLLASWLRRKFVHNVSPNPEPLSFP